MEKTGYISDRIILTDDAMVRGYGRQHIERHLEGIIEGTISFGLRLPVCHGRSGGIRPRNGKDPNHE